MRFCNTYLRYNIHFIAYYYIVYGKYSYDLLQKIEKLKNERGWTDYELAGQAMVTKVYKLNKEKQPTEIRRCFFNK